MAALSIADSLFSHVEGLQERADSSYELYPENQTILPDDALYLVRVMNLKDVCKLIEDVVERSGMSLEKVLKLSIEPNKGAICNLHPYTGEALDAIIKHYGGNE